MGSVPYARYSNLLTVEDDHTDLVNEYDDLNRLEQVTDEILNKTIQYEYYEDGLRKKMTDPESNVIEYTYDKAKRLKTVKKNTTTEATYDYNALGLREKLTRGNGSYTENTFDNTTRWLTGVYNRTSTDTVISSFVYTHDKVMNRKTMQLLGGDAVTYEYDNIYQLTSELRTGDTPYSNTWTYDEVGNRLTQVKDSTTTNYTYNDANQLISEICGSTTTNYEYDDNGNLTSKTIGTDTWTWGYDYKNRQTAYDDPLDDTKDASYTYDAEGRRIAKTVNSVTEKYLYDGANVIADYDGTPTLKATYVTPFLDQNLLTTRYSPLATYYYMQDGLGSVRNIIDSNEATQNTYDYYAFGEALSEVEGVDNRYKFTGREKDKESLNYYYRARYYNPYVGRFTRRDPIEYAGGINLYSYVSNNPSNFTDAYGLICLGVVAEKIPCKIRCQASLVGIDPGTGLFEGRFSDCHPPPECDDCEWNVSVGGFAPAGVTDANANRVPGNKVFVFADPAKCLQGDYITVGVSFSCVCPTSSRCKSWHLQYNLTTPKP